jgi:predicted phosphodiesterase
LFDEPPKTRPIRYIGTAQHHTFFWVIFFRNIHKVATIPYILMDIDTILSEHSQKDHSSRLAFARFLNEHYPFLSVKGWEMRLIRQQDNVASPTKTGTYTYEEKTDNYTTYLSTGALTVSGAKHRQIISDWSNGMSTGQLCHTHGIAESYFKQYKRIHKITRSAIPVTGEQLMEVDDQDGLIDEIIISRRHTLAADLAKEQHKRMSEDSKNWRTLMDDYVVHMTTLSKAPKSVPKIKLTKPKNSYALVVCPTDFHWGKYGWADEVGETYNFDEARKRLMEKTETLVSRISTKPEKIYVGAGSDWFHVDNDAGQTTRGTPQDMCATPAEILITGCKLAREHIDLLRQVAPVEIVMMAGNHDRHTSLALMMYLSAAYEGINDVEITITANNRRYIEYGNTLLGFTHGDSMSRGSSLGSIMSVEARELWGTNEHKVWFHGHLHHQQMHEKDGCLIIQMPSLAGHDRYHARAGYTTSKAGLAAYLIDYKEGYIGSLFAPVSHE